MKILRLSLGLILALLLGVLIWLAVAPPAMIRVATAYTAKIVCSNHFIAARDPAEVLAVDVQAPGHPILGFISIDVDDSAGRVDARLLGLFGRGTALHRSGHGCAVAPDGNVAALAANAPATEPAPLAIDPVPAIQNLLGDESLTGPGMRAVLVLKDKQVIGKTYADGFDAGTPLLGWSMTKTVTAALIGTLVKDGALSLDQSVADAAPNAFGHWASDARAAITVADLMGMASDLRWNEGYGTVSDVTRMLYLEADMAAFAASSPLDAPDGADVGQVFNYSSGTTVLLSRLAQELLGADEMQAMRARLFNPLGMASAVVEADATGTLAGSSYMYATAADWARFGAFVGGAGQGIVPAGFTEWMRAPHPASDGAYGRGQTWMRPPGPARDIALPDDAVWLSGHDGQSVGVFPSDQLVIVRFGLTPSSLGYSPAALSRAVLDALDG
ncbi:serine hydrolase domain-containing protein [Oceanomicrobium pacificus]|uniref:Serine hydrolase n=1 Tax=Oceanomicrobium pacificus TaxID=2692916 RepID=A0A6B0TQ07_9RHOB|nr:serine hydrolase [Oceanomicrobium pacificus]MXU66727.1 serine hydrolase [Oceanomicrobium pacificus]